MIHIEMKDDYTQTTRYYGSANDKNFTVECYYDSNSDHWEIRQITWTTEDLSTLPKKRVEGKIKDFVSKWLFDKQKEEEEENGTV